MHAYVSVARVQRDKHVSLDALPWTLLLQRTILHGEVPGHYEVFREHEWLMRNQARTTP